MLERQTVHKQPTHSLLETSKRAATEIPHDGFSILLSHTPEVYRHAAHAGFDLLLSGHTHGANMSARRYSDYSKFSPAPAHGWSDTPQLARHHPSLQRGSTAFRKLQAKVLGTVIGTEFASTAGRVRSHLRSNVQSHWD
jgi:hypothetical protein